MEELDCGNQIDCIIIDDSFVPKEKVWRDLYKKQLKESGIDVKFIEQGVGG
jgi:hypothetical protein